MMRTRIPLIVIAVMYCASLLWLSFGVPYAFTSPDENANFTFARHLRAYDTLAVIDGITQSLGGVVHPRSAVAVGAYIVPGSFLGLPFVAGLFGKLVGDAGIQYFTPLLLVVALAAWFDLMRRRFGGARMALLSTVLLAAHPAVWYYAARSMMHNVGFVGFLILAAWVAFAEPFTRLAKGAGLRRARLVEFFLAGLFVGLALFFRTSEALWIAAIMLAMVWKFKKAVAGVWPWVVLIIGLAIPLAVSGFLNAELYGSPFVNGYTFEDTSSVVTTEVQVVAPEPASSAIVKVFDVILPFGLHERAIANNIWNFGLALYPFYSALAAAGLILALRDKAGQAKWLAIVTLCLAVWLGVVYGSWSFNDNPDPTAVTLADSHVRYWLPLYVLSTIFAARAIAALVHLTEGKSVKGVQVAVVAASLVVLLSAVTVFGGEDGLWRARQELFESSAKRQAVIAQTETDSIIVVDRADKFLWPYRHVIQPLRDERTYSVLPKAVAIAPLYYFGIPFPPSDLDYLNNVKLAELGLRIDFVSTIDDEALYRLTPVQ